MYFSPPSLVSQLPIKPDSHANTDASEFEISWHTSALAAHWQSLWQADEMRSMLDLLLPSSYVHVLQTVLCAAKRSSQPS